MTEDRVTENRLAESGRAARNRGSQGHSFDTRDYPRVPNEQDVVEAVNEFRDDRPAIVLTHGFKDPYNMDHPLANEGTLKRVCAEEPGCASEGQGSRDDAPPAVILEPHQSERCHYRPPALFEITSIGERKRDAHGVDGRPVTPCEVPDERVELCAVERAPDSGQRHIQYAEAFQRIDPRATDRLS